MEQQLPAAFCKHWSHLFEDLVSGSGWSGVDPGVPDLQNRASLGWQPRGCKLPPLLTDFLEPQAYDVAEHPDLADILPGCRIPDGLGFPKGSRVLRGAGQNGFAMLGLPREPLAFLSAASELVHPVERAGQVSSAIAAAVASHRELTPLDLLKARQQFFRQALETIKNLSAREAQLHENMPSHLAKVMRGKRLLFLDKLLTDIGHPDDTLFNNLSKGFPLFGWLTKTGLFPESWCPPALHPSELLRVARKQNHWVLNSSQRGSHQLEIDEAVWRTTMDEVNKGWAEGPFSLVEAEGMTTSQLIVSRRFGVAQKTKVRAIDDFSASNINACTGTKEKVRVESVDAAATMIRTWMKAFEGTGRALVGRTYDLKSAYRQLGISAEHLHAAWISVFDPSGQGAKLFRLNALPFGASASVSNFLRCAEALKAVGAKLLNFAWTSFFDDFILVTPADMASETDKAVKLFFKLLGWTLASDDEKCKPFSTTFTALGVVFDLTEAPAGILRISNTASRKLELSGVIDDVLESKRLSAKAASSLRSRLNFADAQIFGRYAKKALQLLGEHAACPSSDVVDGGLLLALKWLKERVLQGSPKVVSIQRRPTWLLFLDGACEGEGASLSCSIKILVPEHVLEKHCPPALLTCGIVEEPHSSFSKPSLCRTWWH